MRVRRSKNPLLFIIIIIRSSSCSISSCSSNGHRVALPISNGLGHTQLAGHWTFASRTLLKGANIVAEIYLNFPDSKVGRANPQQYLSFRRQIWQKLPVRTV